MAKTFKTAKAILKHSLAQIEAGHWCKGNLVELIDETFDAGYACAAKEKPMGCALGLISMFGGHGIEGTISVGRDGDWQTLKVFHPAYPNEGNAPAGVLKARAALVDAIPARTVNKLIVEAEREGAANPSDPDGIVVRYNDRDSMRQKKAADWFRRALELV